ncbi:MAG: glycosyltransferase family 2 protein [Alphaproteobacteria bacterium]
MRLTRLAGPLPDPRRCTLFCQIRDEAYLLPHFLAHYRALGIERFAFVDDRSGDGTREMLLAEPDCLVIECDRRWGERTADGIPVHDVIRRRGPESLVGAGWVLTVDADEFLVPPVGYPDVAALAAELEGRGERCMAAAMVDFFPPTLAGRNYDPALSPFAACPRFDRGPLFDWRPGWIEPIPAVAGVRARLAAMLAAEHPAEFRAVFGGDYRPASLWKVPLLRWGTGIVPAGPHCVSATPFLGLQAALAHFKLCPGLDAKIGHATVERGYFGASVEYRFLARAIALFPDRPLASIHTARWAGAASLEAAGHTFSPGRGPLGQASAKPS